MRPRKKKNLDARMEACSYLFRSDAESLRKNWQSAFAAGSNLPIHLEIGCGKGAFIIESARREPDRNFVAIERVADVLVMAAESADEAGVSNLLFISDDAARIAEIFAPGEVDRIYLNFSDPWPKARHAKRRLTSPMFLERYKSILPAGGEIVMKTDNDSLFEYSLEEFEAAGFALLEVTRDLHKIGDAENIMTEYERHFAREGVPIKRLRAVIR